MKSLTPAEEAVVERALWASLETLEGYSERLEADVGACRAKVP